MNNPIEQWANESSENRRLLNQETLIVEISETIWQAMENQQVSKAELAKRLGKSRAYVSQLLDGSRNMTLRTLADIATVLNIKIHIQLTEVLSIKTNSQSCNTTVEENLV